MEQQRSNATGKLRNLKDFLVSNRSFRKGSGSKKNASQSHMESTTTHSYQDGPDGIQEYSSQRRSSQTNQNSVSLFDLVDPPMSSSRPTSMALSVNVNIHAIHDTTFNSTSNHKGHNMGKSVSMHGLSSNDCRPSSSAISKRNQHSSSRNPAVKLFNTIRAKLGIKRKDHRHNKIVDNSKSSFGSYFSSPSSGNKTPVRSSSSILQCDNLILSSSRSQDNILSSNAMEVDLQMETNEASSELLSGGLHRSTSALSSPQINCLGVSDSSSSAIPAPASVDHLHSRSASQNENSGTMNHVYDLRPPIPLKQRALRDVTANSSHPIRDNVPSSPLKGSLTKELCDLLHYGWYWGGMSKDEAEEKLKGEPDGAFVVRDSSSDHYLLSLSFNSNGKSLHTRIEYRSGKFCFYSSEMESFGTVAELIDYWVTNSEQGTFCYSRSRHRNADIPSYPVRLSKPISRFTEVKSLAHLSRFVIRQYTRLDLIPQLPLPQSLIEYVGQQKYI